MLAREGAHVLDHAEHLQIRAPGHVGNPDGDSLGGQGRGGHDQQLGAGQEAAERHLDVAGTGGHVDDEVVELAPADVGEELLEGLGEHQAPPHERLGLVVDQEAHAHDLELPVADGDVVGTDLASVGRTQAAGDAEHAGDAEAPDVGVQHAHAQAPRRHRRGQVDRDARLAHPALAAGHRDHPRRQRDLGGRGIFGQLPPHPLHQVGALLLGHLAELDPGLAHARQAPELRFDVLFDLGAQGTAGDGEHDRRRHRAVVTHVDLPDHAQVDDVGAELGVDDTPQHAEDVVF